MGCLHSAIGGSNGKESLWNVRVRVQSLGQEDPLDEGRATHSSILAWRIPWNRGAWWATVPGISKSRTRLSNWHFHSATNSAGQEKKKRTTLPRTDHKAWRSQRLPRRKLCNQLQGGSRSRKEKKGEKAPPIFLSQHRGQKHPPPSQHSENKDLLQGRVGGMVRMQTGIMRQKGHQILEENKAQVQHSWNQTESAVLDLKSNIPPAFDGNKWSRVRRAARWHPENE